MGENAGYWFDPEKQQFVAYTSLNEMFESVFERKINDGDYVMVKHKAVTGQVMSGRLNDDYEWIYDVILSQGRDVVPYGQSRLMKLCPVETLPD